MTTVALYTRVTTKDKGQSTEKQLSELQRFAQAHGCTVYKGVRGAGVWQALRVSGAACPCPPAALRLGAILELGPF
jgi:PII-like signaling protein